MKDYLIGYDWMPEAQITGRNVDPR